MFEIEDLVAIATGAKSPVGLQQAKLQGRSLARHNPAIKRVIYFVLLASDELALVSVGRRGGHRVEWVFGPLVRLQEAA
jgi:hypothetical protein